MVSAELGPVSAYCALLFVTLAALVSAYTRMCEKQEGQHSHVRASLRSGRVAHDWRVGKGSHNAVFQQMVVRQLSAQS